MLRKSNVMILWNKLQFFVQESFNSLLSAYISCFYRGMHFLNTAYYAKQNFKILKRSDKNFWNSTRFFLG